MPARLSTGLRSFDSELDGGIPSGSVVVVQVPPAAPAELLFGAFAVAPDVDATYVTTLHSPGRVRRTLNICTTKKSDTGTPDQVSIIDARASLKEGSASAFASTIGLDLGLSPNAAREQADTVEGKEEIETETESSRPQSPDGGNNTTSHDNTLAPVDESTSIWVFDSATDVLEQISDWREFLMALSTTIEDNGGIAYLHLRMSSGRSPTQAEAIALDIANIVFEYQLERGDETTHGLSVLRFLGAAPPKRRIPLEVTDCLDVNPNRRM